MSLTPGAAVAARAERYEDPHLEVDFARASAALDSRRMVLTRKDRKSTRLNSSH